MQRVAHTVCAHCTIESSKPATIVRRRRLNQPFEADWVKSPQSNNLLCENVVGCR